MAKATKILVVDDEPDIAGVVGYNLEKEGFTVVQAHDGEAALRKIRLEKPDLLILDLMLPGMSGLDICKTVRANPQTSQLPIIMLTAKSDELDRILGLEIGADDYVTKPFSVKELMARVRSILRRVQDNKKSTFPAQSLWMVKR